VSKSFNKNNSLAVRETNFSIRDLVSVFFRRKWLILLTLLTAAAAAGVFAWMTPEMYESEMKIIVRNMRADSPLTAGADSVSEMVEVSQAQITAEIELLKSRDLLTKVVEDLNLAIPEEPGAALTGADAERAVLKLNKDLNISEVKKSNIIEVRYASKSPEKAAAVLKLLSELYLEKHLKLHRPPGTYEFFKEQADQYEKDLRSSENTLSNFQQRQNVVEIKQQKELTFSRLVDTRSKLKDLNGTIQETKKKIEALKNQLSKTESRIKTQNRVMPNQASAERMSTMLVELRNKRIELLAKFRPEDRVIKEVDAQIKVTSEALNKAINTTSAEESYDVNPLRQLLESDLAKATVEQNGQIALQKNLSEQVNKYEAELANLEKVTPVHDKLSRDVKKNEESYQLYAKKQEESRINDALDKQKISNVSIAEEPFVPKTPNKNSKLLAIVMGLGFGILVCIGSVFTSELMRNTFNTPRELEEYVGFPVLATIPQQTIEERREVIRNHALAGNLDTVLLTEEATAEDLSDYEEEKDDKPV
jgi:uncharacterized protein involved in exopolysaccharide biosynthesis